MTEATRVRSPLGASAPGAARIDVVGLGPAGPELVTGSARELMARAERLFVRTARHPAAVAVPQARTFDHHYEHEGTFDAVYRAIVADLVDAARSGPVVYAVPGSPLVAERTVALLRADRAVVTGEVAVAVHPALSFLDLAYARLGIDPLAAGVRLVDGESFATDAAGSAGPLLVAQCWSKTVLSGVKLAAEPPAGTTVTVLHHLGLPDEAVWDLPWEELDRAVDPDHLTSLWIPELGAPVAAELAGLDELVHVLRERCPWDREQTHGSLSRHLLEESYEVLEAIDGLVAAEAEGPVGTEGPAAAEGAAEAEGSAAAEGAAGAARHERVERAVAHLEEELGDLLYQVYFHATLAAEEGRFSLADVARGIHDKLVSRHPHVFGGTVASSSDQVASNWEASKLREKGRASVTEGIPAAMPGLALAAKLQRKALTVGVDLPGARREAAAIAAGLDRIVAEDGAGDPSSGERSSGSEAAVGDLLFSVVSVARQLGIDPETALRARSLAFRHQIIEHEGGG